MVPLSYVFPFPPLASIAGPILADPATRDPRLTVHVSMELSNPDRNGGRLAEVGSGFANPQI